MKKLFCTFLSVVLLISMLSGLALAKTTDAVAEKQISSAVYEGRDVILRNLAVLPESGWIIVTEEVGNPSFETEQVLRSDPDRQVTKTFSHQLFKQNGVSLNTSCITTVTGTYSQADGWAQIDSVTAYFSGDEARNLDYTSSASGNKGYLYLYCNGAFVGSITYSISTNGLISQV